ncbi:hypothetical protein CsSME_00045176 [Camellia sinensis var. sinensis]
MKLLNYFYIKKNGRVNPNQCEAFTMVCTQLNVLKPMIANALLHVSPLHVCVLA